MLCESEDLSLESLQKRINLLTPTAMNLIRHSGIDMWKYENPFFHHVCMNENVTLEIIECCINTFPAVSGASTNVYCPSYSSSDSENNTYPLHLACSNKNFPSVAIKLLLNKFPKVLSHMSLIDEGATSGQDDEWVYGLPLHYYLSRQENIDIDTVKMLVEAYPQALSSADDNWKCYPIHTAVSNPNIDNKKSLLEYLIQVEPSSLQFVDGWNRAPLQVACLNKSMDSNTVKYILSSWSAGLYQRDISGELPIHALCTNDELDEQEWFDIFHVLFNEDPTILRERSRDDGDLPIHKAARSLSTAICKTLIGLYPESVRELADGPDGTSKLPIHEACTHGKVDTADYLLGIYPESICVEDAYGHTPIHCINRTWGTELIEVLLKHDPTAASRKMEGICRLPLHIACRYRLLDINIIKTLFDAYPLAIQDRDDGGYSALDLAKEESESDDNLIIINFLQTQLEYAKKAQDMNTMTTLDQNGWLPLHHALKDNAPLGSIKLLLMGNTSAIRMPDYDMAFPLHIACEFSSVRVVQFMMEMPDERTWNHLDMNKDSILHYACRGGNCEVVKYFLDKKNAHVSEHNKAKKLPIHMLFESYNDTVDRDSKEYIETVWLLLLAHPETVMNW